MVNLIPSNYFTLPTLTDTEDDLLMFPQTQQGNISISEDDKNVYVDVAVPGINPEDIEVTYDKGVLWVRGETKAENKDKKRKFYSKATSAFSYKVTVPGDIAQNTEPEATCENGLLMLTFPKATQKTPKKISVKLGKSNGKTKGSKS